MPAMHTNPLTSLFVILLLLAANAFFVAAEFALVKARDFRIQNLADDGRRAARLTLRIQRDLEAYLAACQLGITMASLGLGWVGEPAVAAILEPLFGLLGFSDRALHAVSFLTGFIAFSSLHIVVGEQVPKTLAIRRPEPVSLAAAYPLHAFFLACYPLTWALNRASRWILTRLQIEESTHAQALTSEELRGLIDTSTEQAELTSHGATMLHNVFQFDDRPVERIMIPRREVDHLDLRADDDTSRQLLLETSHSRLPLLDGGWGHLLGVVLVKEALVAMVESGAPLPTLADLARDPLMVPESQRIARLLETMRAERAHMAFVLDEYGEFVGLVTLEDLVEEIVGEIADELDEEEPTFGLRPTADGWEAHGLAPLPDVERATGFAPGPIEANTLSGFFMQRLERMPKVGDEWTEGGYRLRVAEVDQHHVRRCELTRVPDIDKLENGVPPDSAAPTQETEH